MAKQESSIIVSAEYVESRTVDIKLWFEEEEFSYKNVLLTRGPVWLKIVDYQPDESMPSQTVATINNPSTRLLDLIENYQVNISPVLSCKVKFLHEDRSFFMEDAVILHFSLKEMTVIGALRTCEDEKIYDIFSPNSFKLIEAKLLPSYIRFEDLLEEEE